MPQIQTENVLIAGPIPLYYQLEQHLRNRIVAREFGPGALLPTEDQVCEQYGVSRITVRRALDALQQQGLIERRRGVGSFVTERSAGINNRLSGSLVEFLASASMMRNTILSLGEAVPHGDVIETLGLGPGDRAYLVKAIGALDDEGPVAYLEIWFPSAVGQALDAASLNGKRPVIRVVEERMQVRLSRAEQVIDADHAGPDAARHLCIDPLTPVLRVKRVYYAAPEQPVEVAYVRYHPDRYHYAVEFKG